MGELPIIGQDQQTFGVGIEPADVEEALLFERPLSAFRQHVGDRPPAFRILHGDNDATGLVEGKVEMAARRRDTGTVDPDYITVRVDPAALLGNDLGVHFDTPLADQGFTGTAGAYAGLGKNLLEAYALFRLTH
jgi:hypothetical protein